MPALPKLPDLARIIGALVVGAMGGLVFSYLHLPLPWTLGSLFAVGVTAIFGSKALLPPSTRHVARPMVGVLAGSAFTAEIVASMTLWWPVIPTIIVYTLVTAGLGTLFFMRACRYDKPTAIFAGFPGGLSELTMVGASMGADVRRLALVHTARVIVVIFSIPLIVQAWIGAPLTGTAPAAAAGAEEMIGLVDWVILIGCASGGYLLRKLFRPLGGAMVAALLLSAIAHGAGLTAAHPPAWLVAMVQVVIGSTVGSRLGGASRGELARSLLQGASWAVVLIFIAAITAFIATHFLPFDAPTLLLAFSPGGLAEITLLAYAIGLEVAFIVTAQVCRVVGTLVLAPLILTLTGGGSPPAIPSSTPSPVDRHKED
ncbi:MAG: AbrB family transcriptional regulator [Devosia sp.]